MDRRQALKITAYAAGSLGVFGSLAIANPANRVRFGAFPPVSREPRRRFRSTFAPFNGVSRTHTKDVLLYEHLNKEIGPIVPHSQSNVGLIDGEGDCVAHATAISADILAATQIHMIGRRERFIAKASVEMIYAGSRIEIGEDLFGNSGGSTGHWAADYVKKYGILHRIPYKDGDNTLDLSGYSPERSRQYKRTGVPDWLERIAREHPIKEATNVKTGQEVLDAVCAGQPVIMCSTYEFHTSRDADGFATPYIDERWRFGRPWRQWWHCMAIVGAVLSGPRKGGTCLNSHGPNWIDGPQPRGMPDGSFNIDTSVLDLMAKDWGDCWALSCYRGHEAKRMRHKLYR